VSGDLRLANSGVAPLVTSLAALAEAVPIGEFAVIGGLAVLARLQGAHRVTYDLDTVATQHGDELTAVEAVISTEGVDGLLLGTKIDCIAVGDVPASDISPDLLPEGEADCIFVLAHRWALDTAEDLTLIAEEGGEVVAEARCRIATPASLVAMRLQSAPKRRAARAEKAGGDYLDLFRLTSHPEMTRPLPRPCARLPTTPSTLGTLALEAGLPPHVALPIHASNDDHTFGICIWEGESVESVKEVVEGAVGPWANNEYIEMHVDGLDPQLAN